jgi:glycosyltransferase involved in cell wall biosynthesis
MSLRILVIAYELVRPDKSAGDLRLFNLLAMMAKRNRIDFWSIYEGDGGRAADASEYEARLKAVGVRVLPNSYEHLERAMARKYYDIGFFEFYHSAKHIIPAFRGFQPGARVIVDSVDVHFVREDGAAAVGEIGREQVEQTRRIELATYRAADSVLVATERDGAILTAEGEMPPIFVIPIVMPTRPRRGGWRGCEAIFVGGFGHLPNVDALRWFIHEIWPSIHDEVPEAQFTIIGSNAPPEVRAYGKVPGVEVLGFVPDVNTYLDRAAVSVAPLRFGAGMKGKVIEAMASGVPVVTTTIGAQGISTASGENLMIVDDAADFARAVISLFKNAGEAERLGLAGQRRAATLCGPANVYRALKGVLRTVTARRGHLVPMCQWGLGACAYHGLRRLGYRRTYELRWSDTEYFFYPVPMRRPLAELARLLLRPRRLLRLAAGNSFQRLGSSSGIVPVESL